MNCPYGYLKEDDTDDNEIETDKELRKFKKKLRSLKQKKDLEGCRKLEILINEYENINKPVQVKKTKIKTNYKKESDSFLEKEYQKNKAMNAKKYADQERKQKEERKKKEEQKKQKKQQEQQEQQDKEDWPNIRGYNCTSQVYVNYQIMKTHGLNKHDIPSDILEIILDYSHILWKKLLLKYHPDKYDGNDTYSKLLNCLKDVNNSV